MSGLDLAAAARAADPTLPIAMMTAHASVDYAVDALRRDADEFLVKPVAAAHLGTPCVHADRPCGRDRDAAGDRGQWCWRSAPTRTTWRSASAPRSPSHRAAGDAVVILTLSSGAVGGDVRAPPARGARRRRASSARGCSCTTSRTPGSTRPTASSRRSRSSIREVEPDRRLHPLASTTGTRTTAPSSRPSTVAARRVPSLACFQSPSSTIDFRPTRFVPGRRLHRDQAARCSRLRVAVRHRDYMEPGLRARHRPLLVPVRRRASTPSRSR